MEDGKRLGQLVRKKRLALNMTQTQLGDAVGMSQRWISTLERGETDVPRRVHLHALANAIGLDVSELYVAADMARDEAKAKAAAEDAPMVDKDDPLYNTVFWEIRSLAPEDLDFIRSIIKRIKRERNDS